MILSLKSGIASFFAYVISSLLFSLIGTLILIFKNTDSTPIIVLVSSILLTLIYIPFGAYFLHLIEKKYIANEKYCFIINFMLAIFLFSIMHIAASFEEPNSLISFLLVVFYFSSPIFLCLAIKTIFEYFLSQISKLIWKKIKLIRR